MAPQQSCVPHAATTDNSEPLLWQADTQCYGRWQCSISIVTTGKFVSLSGSEEAGEMKASCHSVSCPFTQPVFAENSVCIHQETWLIASIPVSGLVSKKSMKRMWCYQRTLCVFVTLRCSGHWLSLWMLEVGMRYLLIFSVEIHGRLSWEQSGIGESRIVCDQSNLL